MKVNTAKQGGLFTQVRYRIEKIGDGVLYLVAGFVFLVGEIALLFAFGIL